MVNEIQENGPSDGRLFEASEHELEKNFKTQIISGGSEFLLRTKSSDNVGAVSTAGQPADRLGKVDRFRGFKTKKIPAERLMLGDCLGHHRVFTGVGIFAQQGIRKLVCDDQGLLATVAKGLNQIHR